MAERGGGLIDRKAGPVGGDLEQHSAGLTKIDRPEIVSILLVGGTYAVICHKLARERRLFGVVGRPEGDVMYGAAAHAAGQESFGLAQVDDGGGFRRSLATAPRALAPGRANR